MTTISMHGTKLTDICLSHSMKCPLGGGFWVYAPEQGHIAGCTEDGTPVCECTPEMHLQFEDGSAIVVSVSSEFLDNTPIGAAVNLAGLRDRPFSCFDRMLSDGGFTRMPLRTRISIASTAAIGHALSELAPKPISAMSFTQEFLTAYKAVAMLVISDELAKSTAPGANDLFANELRKAVGLASDSKFLEIISASTGITSSPSSGLSTAQFLDDLDDALQAVEVGVNSKLYLILPVAVAKSIVLLRDSTGPSTKFSLPDITVNGGTIQGIRVVVTSAATNDGILLDASAIAADSDLVTTEVVRNATLKLDDNPTAGTYQIVSLWQQNLQCMRAERFFGAAVLRSDGIAIISDMAST